MENDELERAYNFLVAKKVASRKKIDEIFEESKKNNLDFFEVLHKKNIIDEEISIKIKAEFLNIPYVDLKDKILDVNILKEIPEKAAIFYKFIPFKKTGNILKVAMVDPTNIDALDALKFISIKHNINEKIYVISQNGFNNAIKQYRTFSEELKDVLKNVDRQIVSRGGASKKQEEEIKVVLEEEAPVSRIVDIIISHAVEGKASDIHIEPTQDELKVRYRLDGMLHDSLILPKKISSVVVSRIKILADLKIDETRKPQDGRFRFEVKNRVNAEKSVDLRVSTFPTVNGEKVVMRILDTSSDISSLENLGIWQKGLKMINKNINKPFGIILITGPTGSGKSTTLYAILKMLNREGVNIVTLEDPVEYYLDGINQSQVQPEIGYTFSSGLRSILRQDPDIIMVGEIRDKETAELATHAALTGHLVLSTLHTNNVIGVIPRLIDMGIEPFLIASSLNVAVGQRLVKKVCNFCKEEIKASPAMEKFIRKELEEIPDVYKSGLDLEGDIKLFCGKGCAECKKAGTSGRIGVFEVLSMTPELEEVISSKMIESEIIKEAKRQEMITMRQDGIIKVLNGLTTIEEVLRATEE